MKAFFITLCLLLILATTAPAQTPTAWPRNAAGKVEFRGVLP